MDHASTTEFPKVGQLLGEDEPEALRVLLDAQVRFVIIGGRAVQFHGHPRSTKDLDLLVEPTPENGRRLRDAMKALGTCFKDPNAVENFSEDRHTKVALHRYPVEFLTAIDGPRFAEAWADAVLATVEGKCVRIISRAHLITSKLPSSRAIDADDVKALSEPE
jgi:hypothetical protein